MTVSDEERGQVIAKLASRIEKNKVGDSSTAVLTLIGLIAGAALGGDVSTGEAVAGHEVEMSATGFGSLSGLVSGTVLNLIISSSIPNPWMVMNGHAEWDSPSPLSAKYKKHRKMMKVSGAAASILGAAASASTASINVASEVKHLNAAVSSGAHIIAIQAIADSYAQSRTIAEWCALLVKLKRLKAAIRGGQALAGFGGAAIALTGSIAAAAAKTGIKLRYIDVVYNTAAQIHWRAYREQVINRNFASKGGTEIGPASRIYGEIFERRGFTQVFGQYDAAGMIMEPGGWEPLVDKLLLM